MIAFRFKDQSLGWMIILLCSSHSLFLLLLAHVVWVSYSLDGCRYVPMLQYLINSCVPSYNMSEASSFHNMVAVLSKEL